MQVAPLPACEIERLEALRRYGVLDTPPESDFDDIARLAGQICNTPIALVSLVDTCRQWFKAHQGLDASETHRDLAFCAHAILNTELFEVPNALEDARFSDSPLVLGPPHIRFYAGAPLITPDGFALGTLCVIDTVPRRLDGQQRWALQALAHQVISQLELRRQSARLAQMNASKDKFLALLAHDLRAPFNSILGLSSRLKEKLGQLSPERLHTVVDSLHGSASQAFRLVENLLKWARFETGHLPCQPQALPLDGVVAELAQLFSPQAEQKAIRLQLPATALSVQADPDMLSCMLQNLLSNAIKFTPEGGEVELTLQQIDHEIELAVRDSGIGMDQQHLARLFELGQAGSRSGTAGERGTGLGLILCKEFAQRLGGSLQVASSPGVGTTMRLRLPRPLP